MPVLYQYELNFLTTRNYEVKKQEVEVPYFAMYNAHFFAQIFEGKIRMHTVYGYNDYMPWV